MLKLLTTLENLFTKYTPWHSEAEMREALAAVQEIKDEITKVATAPSVEAAAVTAVEEVPSVVSQVEEAVHPTTVPVTETAVPSADVVSETTVTPAATAEPVHIPEPEPTPFPGSYTPPPAS